MDSQDRNPHDWVGDLRSLASDMANEDLERIAHQAMAIESVPRGRRMHMLRVIMGAFALLRQKQRNPMP